MTTTDSDRFWQRLREFSRRVKLDSVNVGFATIRFTAKSVAGDDAYTELLLRLQPLAQRSVDVFAISAHNVDEVTLVDEIQADHECEVLNEAERHPGGSGANSAFVLGRLGAAVSITGCMGDDAEANLLRSSLAGADVNLNLVASVSGPSGRTRNIVDRHGRRLLIVEPNANSLFGDTLGEGELISAARGAKVLHLSSFVDERSLSLQARVAAAVSDDTLVSLVPGALYARRGLDRLDSLLRSVDVLFVYREQLRLLLKKSSAATMATGSALQDELEAYFAWRAKRGISRPHVVVVKDPIENDGLHIAERFLAVACGRTSLERFFYPRELPRGVAIRAVDTTGAGDAAAAAFLYAMLNAAPMEDSLDAAFLLASFASTMVGARSSFADADALLLSPTAQELLPPRTDA